MKRHACSIIAVISVLLICAATTNDALSQDKTNTDLAKSVVGTWRIISSSNLDLETKKVSATYGDHPAGYLQYSSGGHLVVFLSVGNPVKAEPPYSDLQRIAIYNGMIGYAGTYKVQGNKVTHHIITASVPHWIGTDQIRYVQLNGKTLTIKTQQNVSPQTGHKYVTTLIWERVE